MLVSLAIVVTASIAITGALADLGVAIDRVAVASLGAALTALFVGLATMLVGAATGRRAVAIGVGTALFAASYLLVGLAGLVSWIEPLPRAVPAVSRNRDAADPERLPGRQLAVLAALCIAAAIGTVNAFDRQDLTR